MVNSTDEKNYGEMCGIYLTTEDLGI